MYSGAAALENRLAVPQTLSTELPDDPASPLVGIDPREMKTDVHTETRTQMFTAASFIRAEKWKLPACASAGEQINHRQCLRTRESCLTLRREKARGHGTTWVDLEDVMLSGRSRCHSQKAAYGVTPLKRSVQNRQPHRSRQQLGGCGGAGEVQEGLKGDG